MSLPQELIDFLDNQIAAGLPPENLQAVVRRALSEWEVNAEDLAQYLFERLQQDVLLRESLRFMLVSGVTEAPPPHMPADMAERIRRGLFEPQLQAAAPTQPDRETRRTLERHKLPALTTLLKLDSDAPDFTIASVDTRWDREGPFFSSISWKVNALEEVWGAQDNPAAERRLARQYLLQWRAVERLMHLDFTALKELQAWRESNALTPEIVGQLQECKDRMLEAVVGISNLLEPSEAWHYAR